MYFKYYLNNYYLTVITIGLTVDSLLQLTVKIEAFIELVYKHGVTKT